MFFKIFFPIITVLSSLVITNTEYTNVIHASKGATTCLEASSEDEIMKRRIKDDKGRKCPNQQQLPECLCCGLASSPVLPAARVGHAGESCTGAVSNCAGGL